MKALNLGCGNDYKESTDVEWVNLDRGNCQCDVSHDIEVFPYPFEDNEFDFVLAQHILEHVRKENFPKVIRELYRITKDEGIWHILVPHGSSDNYLTDHSHYMPFTIRTLDYFDNTKPLRENGIIYGYGDIDILVDAKLLENPPNGPDIKFTCIMNKEK